jgi:hypothetical protein
VIGIAFALAGVAESIAVRVSGEEIWRRDMNLPAVLVVGSSNNTELTDAMFECGLTPVFRETILAAIAALRKEQFLAVVVDHQATEVDPLEITLNIRDVNERVRVFVLAEDDEEPDESQYPEFVSVVQLRELVRKLTPTTVPMPKATGEKASTSPFDAEARG